MTGSKNMSYDSASLTTSDIKVRPSLPELCFALLFQIKTKGQPSQQSPPQPTVAGRAPLGPGPLQPAGAVPPRHDRVRHPHGYAAPASPSSSWAYGIYLVFRWIPAAADPRVSHHLCTFMCMCIYIQASSCCRRSSSRRTPPGSRSSSSCSRPRRRPRSRCVHVHVHVGGGGRSCTLSTSNTLIRRLTIDPSSNNATQTGTERLRFPVYFRGTKKWRKNGMLRNPNTIQ